MAEIVGDRWGKHLGAGLELAVAVLLGFTLGYWLDHKWGTSPWLLLGGVLLGGVAGFYGFLKSL